MGGSDTGSVSVGGGGGSSRVALWATCHDTPCQCPSFNQLIIIIIVRLSDNKKYWLVAALEASSLINLSATYSVWLHTLSISLFLNNSNHK